MLISRRRPSSALPAVRRVAGAVAAMAAALVLAGGCVPGSVSSAHTSPASPASQTSSAPPAVSASSLSFHYQASAGEHVINQTLTITNTSGWPVVPVLQFTPLDASGHSIGMVGVTTAYGSDHGQLVVGPTSYDVLAFSGAGYTAVADVRVDVLSVTVAKHAPVVQGITTAFRNSFGARADQSALFTDVVLTNANDADAFERIVYIVWDQPTDPRESQRAVSVSSIGDLVTIPRHGSVTVHVSGYAATMVRQYGSSGAAVSVEVFPSQ